MRNYNEEGLPGRLDDLKLFAAWVEPGTNWTATSFLFELAGNADNEGLQVCYESFEQKFWVMLDDAVFRVALDYPRDKITELDCLCLVRKVLGSTHFVEAKQVAALKRWRKLLQVQPAKVLHLPLDEEQIANEVYQSMEDDRVAREYGPNY